MRGSVVITAVCALSTLIGAAPSQKVFVASIVNSSMWNDYQDCYYGYSVFGSTGGDDTAFIPFTYNHNGVRECAGLLPVTIVACSCQQPRSPLMITGFH